MKNTKQKIDEKIVEYLKKNFGKTKKILKVASLQAHHEGVEMYGFNSILILVKAIGDTVYFRPLFKIKSY